MRQRIRVWHSSKFSKMSFDYPWCVTVGKPETLNDYEDSFKTLPEAHSFAMDIVAAEEAHALAKARAFL